MSEYLQIKYRNSCDIGGTVFQAPQNAFFYVMYLNVDPGKSTFELIEEGREDGEKNFVRDFAKLQKTYEITTVVPEYIFDALCAIQLHDTIYIRKKNEERSRAYNFRVTNNGWNDNGNRVAITITYTLRYDVVTGCCNNEKIVYTPCYQCTNLTVTGWISNTSATYLRPKLVPVQHNSYYVVGQTNGAELINNKIYVYRYGGSLDTSDGTTIRTKPSWVEYIGGKDQVVCFTLSGVNYRFLWDGQYWQPVRFIRDITVSGTDARVRCWMYPNTFAQLYESMDGVNYSPVGNPVFGGTIQNAGVVASGLIAGLHYFKVLVYNNNCNYGFTTVVTATV